MPLSVSYKPFGHEGGEEIGEVVIFDDEKMAADPVLAANTEEGASSAMVTLIPWGHESPGITELGYKPAARPKPSPSSTASRFPNTEEALSHHARRGPRDHAGRRAG